MKSKKEVDEHISITIEKQSEEIKKLNEHIVRLNKKCIDQYIESRNLAKDLEYACHRAEEAISMANYNEHYSRKFNIKVTNFKGSDNNLKENFVKMVKEDLKLQIDQRDVIAIHRINSNKGGTRPVIVKMINSDAKTQIMKRRKQTKDNIRLYDDITYKNQDLIKRLKKHKDIATAYYFNCGIYGKTQDGTQIRFDISDDIHSRIEYELNTQETFDEQQDMQQNINTVHSENGEKGENETNT